VGIISPHGSSIYQSIIPGNYVEPPTLTTNEVLTFTSMLFTISKLAGSMKATDATVSEKI